MTLDQLREFAAEVAREAIAAVRDQIDTGETPASGKRYVFGIRGISSLFNVSLPTAQRYKDTFLKPAVIQRGRKIMVDADKAIELYNSRNL